MLYEVITNDFINIIIGRKAFVCKQLLGLHHFATYQLVLFVIVRVEIGKPTPQPVYMNSYFGIGNGVS